MSPADIKAIQGLEEREATSAILRSASEAFLSAADAEDNIAPAGAAQAGTRWPVPTDLCREAFNARVQKTLEAKDASCRLLLLCSSVPPPEMVLWLQLSDTSPMVRMEVISAVAALTRVVAHAQTRADYTPPGLHPDGARDPL